MAENRNLALQLLITAKDEASAIFDKVFGALNDGTNVIATAVRNGFSNLFGGAIDSAAAFETQLGKVVAKGDESYADTAKLKTGLQDLAAQFGITGTEAAQGMEVLAAAGLNAGDAMKALPAVLNLAKIEGISLDDAATKLSDSLSIMGLGFGEAGRMADVLAKGANISTASAASLAEALSVAGGQAKSAGMDLEATVAALDLLHSAGIKGSAAGTSLAAVLTQLQNPASKASQELDKLGITSRDLGDVLDGLKAQGAKSNAAILAFGETAGPGLRAMIEKGSAGLKDYDAQLRNAGGAASESAKKLSMDFDSAVKALSAAWESIKVAFAEPVLKPLADGAREAADALNTALKDGALKPVQEAIKTFAENGVSAIRDFIKTFDFESAIAALQGFANNSKQWFGEIKDAGTTTADAVTVAWNALSAGFKTIGAGLLEIVAKTTGALAAAEEAASKIGLGSAERAAELRATANGLEADAAQLMQSVAQDGQELTAAFNRLTGVTDDAAAAQERLRAALSSEDIGTLKAQVAAYTEALQLVAPGSQAAVQYTTLLKAAQAELDQALGKTTVAATGNAAATEKVGATLKSASADAAQAKPALDEYHALWQKNAEGATQLVEATLKAGGGTAELTRVVGTARAGMEEWNGTLVKSHDGVTSLGDGLKLTIAPLTTVEEKTAEYNRQIKAGMDNAGGWQSGMELNAVKMLGLRDASQATAEKLAYLQSVKDKIPNADKAIAEATFAANAALNLYTKAIGEHIDQLEAKKAAVERANGIEQTSYDLLIAQAKAEGELAALKGDTAGATRAQSDAYDLQVQKAQAAIDKKAEEIAVYRDLIAATQEKLAVDGTLSAADKAQLATMTDTLTAMQQEREGMQQNLQTTIDLTDAKKAKAEADKKAAEEAAAAAQREKEAAESRASAEKAASQVMSDALSVLRDTGGELDVLSQRFYELQGAVTAHAAGWDGWAAGTARAAQEVKASYETQKAAVDAMTATLQNYADTGEWSTTVQQAMVQAGGSMVEQFDLMDQQSLDGLRSALDSANEKLREMQEITQSARERLAELNADLLEAKGEDKKAELLRQQLDYQQQLADIEKQRQLAENAGNTEALAVLNEQKSVLEEINRIKIANIEKEDGNMAAVTRTTQQYRDLSGAIGAARDAAAGLAKTDFSGLASSAESIKSSFSDIRGLL